MSSWNILIQTTVWMTNMQLRPVVPNAGLETPRMVCQKNLRGREIIDKMKNKKQKHNPATKMTFWQNSNSRSTYCFSSTILRGTFLYDNGQIIFLFLTFLYCLPFHVFNGSFNLLRPVKIIQMKVSLKGTSVNACCLWQGVTRRHCFILKDHKSERLGAADLDV